MTITVRIVRQLHRPVGPNGQFFGPRFDSFTFGAPNWREIRSGIRAYKRATGHSDWKIQRARREKGQARPWLLFKVMEKDLGMMRTRHNPLGQPRKLKRAPGPWRR